VAYHWLATGNLHRRLSEDPRGRVRCRPAYAYVISRKPEHLRRLQCEFSVSVPDRTRLLLAALDQMTCVERLDLLTALP
jgi:hypothetical protein